MGILPDINAQVSLDFVAGVSIFLIAFMGAAAFLPGLIIPYVSESDELTLIADRVSIILVEGYLVDSKENPNLLNNTSRIGDFFNNKLGSEYDNTANELGLNSTGLYRSYDLNVSINYVDGSSRSGGETPPSYGNIGQTERVVLVNTTSNETAILSVKVW